MRVSCHHFKRSLLNTPDPAAAVFVEGDAHGVRPLLSALVAGERGRRRVGVDHVKDWGGESTYFLRNKTVTFPMCHDAFIRRVHTYS